MNDTVCLDANVLLESILKNRKHALKAQRYISSHNVVISPLTAHLFVYFGQKDGIALEVLFDLLSKHSFTDCGTTEVRWAIKNQKGGDFEDALQIACAITSQCKSFATFDKNLAQRYNEFITIDSL